VKIGWLLKRATETLWALPEGNNFLGGRDRADNSRVVEGAIALSIYVVNGLDATVATGRRIATIAGWNVAKSNEAHSTLASISLSKCTSVYSSVDCIVIHNILLIIIDYETFDLCR
tara:strand:- start:323 stop:670 length:348 start_codon:yes stop_codon:yes gene_type:complete